jgi:hypothetical protein
MGKILNSKTRDVVIYYRFRWARRLRALKTPESEIGAKEMASGDD